MGAAVGRNEPCPCGSGKKHKQCCLGKPPPEVRRKRAVLPAILILLGIAAGIYVGLEKGPQAGVFAGAAGVVLAGILILTRDPPPPSGSGKSADAINFGK